MDYEALHQKYQERSIGGRYLTLNHIEPLLSRYQTAVVGQSVLGKPIYQLLLGSGKTKIFMWSQMHGNESTTTKALFDFIHFLHSDTPESQAMLNSFTFCLLPMVNPDGAAAYTRENANGVDLNRDAQNLTQPESVVLRQVFETFQPHYAYNLHDQRTIFGAGESGFPATVSFLAPAFNDNRDMNETRIKAIDVIVAMNTSLQQLIPNQVGRFDDGFNLNCIGDTFQSLNVPTILFEAGHFQNDYEREQTRKFIFTALLSGINYLNENDVVGNKIDDYLKIPQNKVVFYDFVYKNVKINYDGNEKIINFAAQYKEVLKDNKVEFEARIAQIDHLENHFGHVMLDACGEQYQDDENGFPNIEQKANFSLGKNIKIVNGLINN
ncbi:M14 metallopeptidase family protein [Flavobacterium sp.]|uniref:M14 family metallopeptidase n=1 Tax=Flavobacterium sp. TaxID=239 RepID=UPI0025F19C29|nr:M14 metallopeptidase family protein [Flavobacterium sp.]